MTLLFVVADAVEGRDLTDKSYLLATEGKNKHFVLNAN